MYQVQTPSNRIKWPSAFFEASTSCEPFEDIRVVTAKSEYVNKAEELALEKLSTQDCIDAAAPQLTQRIIASQTISVHECVRVDKTGITVIINADNVDDDTVMYRALDMVADAMYQLDGDDGEVAYGEPLTFTLSEVPWVIRQ